MARGLSLLLLVGLALLAPAASAAEATSDPQVELLTMGTGADLYARFGHAAFLVRRPGQPGLVYNFGYTDFGDADLVREFLRGRARFWVATERYSRSLVSYIDDDRPVQLQRLALSVAQHRALADKLAWVARPANRHYVYHHFQDNCATRLRDMLDEVTGGALRRQMVGRPAGRASLRQLVHQGFARELALLFLADLIIGREVDRRPDQWEGAFLPRILQQALGQIRLEDGRPFAGPVKVLTGREGPDPLAGYDPEAGVALTWWLAGAACLLALLMVVLARRRPTLAGLPLILLALLTGLSGLLIWPLAAYSTLLELRENELLLSLLPLDLALLWPAVRWLRGRIWAGRLLRCYALLRLAIMALVGIGHLSGLLRQQPLAWPLLSFALALGLSYALRWYPGRPAAGGGAAGPRSGAAGAADQADLELASSSQYDQSGVMPPPR